MEAKFARSPAWRLFSAILFLCAALLLLAYSAFNPMRGAHSFWEYRSKTACRKTEIIAAAMNVYARDHNGHYPTGNSSTEIFQRLIDGHYVRDPRSFFVAGHTFSADPNDEERPADSDRLKPQNVSFDVTSQLDDNSPDDIPIVFLTGFKVSYAPGAPIVSNGRINPFRGISVVYTGHIPTPNWFSFLYGEPQIKMRRFEENENADGSYRYVLPEFIPRDFRTDGRTYLQLTPTGPLR